MKRFMQRYLYVLFFALGILFHRVIYITETKLETIYLQHALDFYQKAYADMSRINIKRHCQNVVFSK